MSTQYVICFSNQSGRQDSFCLFQQLTENKNGNMYSTAWFAKKCAADTKVIFAWNTDWDLTWCQTGKLCHKAHMRAYQVLSADPSDIIKNSATLTRIDGAYQFQTGQTGSETGSLIIHTDSTIPNNDVSVGIGMDDFPAILTQGSPNWTYPFTPKIQYSACFDTFHRGQVIDPSQIQNPFTLSFPVNIHGLYLMLDETNKWSSRPMTGAEIGRFLNKYRKEVGM